MYTICINIVVTVANILYYVCICICYCDCLAQDYAAGVVNVPYVFTGEVFGEPVDSCFVQFNSNPLQLHDDLAKIRITYIALLEYIATLHLHIVRVPTVENYNQLFYIELCKIYEQARNTLLFN